MNREIFRGKLVDDGEWIEGNLLLDDISDIAAIVTYINLAGDIHDLSECSIYRVIPSTIGRDTGLTDKNGMKIFEGDILEALNGNRGYVVFEHGAFMKSCNSKDMPFLIAADVNAVIGNVHDNPELLGGN